MNASVRRSLSAALLLAALAACGRDDHHGIDRHVEDLVTIDHGVYGQATYVDDVGDPAAATSYLPGFGIEVYPLPLSVTLGAAVATTASRADRGFYQLELGPGDYVVCTQFHRCVAITLADGARTRLDYEMSVGPGWSAGTPWPPMP